MKMVTPGGVTIKSPDCPQISLSPVRGASAGPASGSSLCRATTAARGDVDDALFGGLGTLGIGGRDIQHIEVF